MPTASRARRLASSSLKLHGGSLTKKTKWLRTRRQIGFVLQNRFILRNYCVLLDTMLLNTGLRIARSRRLLAGVSKCASRARPLVLIASALAAFEVVRLVNLRSRRGEDWLRFAKSDASSSYRLCFGDFRSRTPGPPPFSSMNWIPPFSKAACILCTVASRPPSWPSTDSRRAMVGSEIPDSDARSD
jgi:hypothetical protein